MIFQMSSRTLLYNRNIKEQKGMSYEKVYAIKYQHSQTEFTPLEGTQPSLKLYRFAFCFLPCLRTFLFVLMRAK